MKKIWVFMFILVSFVIGNTEKVYAEEGWKESYKEFLEMMEQEEERNIEDTVSGVIYSYLLYDIDHNGIPELFSVIEGREVKVYTYKDENILPAGTLNTGYVSFFDAPEENGIVISQRDFIHTSGIKCGLKDGMATFDLLYEDNLDERRKEDPEAQLPSIQFYIPGARYLNLFNLQSRIAIDRYEEIQEILEGHFPYSETCCYPEQDDSFFERLSAENRPVFAVSMERDSNNPGFVPFCELLKKGMIDSGMKGNLEIIDRQTADLNGDGKMECVLVLTDGGDYPIRFFISEQDGIVYVYIQRMAVDHLTVDEYGTLISDDGNSPDLQFLRFVFDKEEGFLLILPYSYVG